MSKKSNKCYLNSKFKQCCCNCKHLWPVHEHCFTNPDLRNEKGEFVCSVQKGWACVAPEFGHVYDNWPQHSIGCELYSPKVKSAAY